MKHLTSAELERVRSGAASAEETAAVGRHVAECGACAAAAEEALSIRDSAAALHAAFAPDETAHARDRQPLRPLVIWSAAAAAAIATAVFLVPRAHEPEPARVPSPPVVRASPRAAVPAAAAVPRPAEWDALVAQTRSSGVLPFPREIRELATGDTFRGGEPGDVARADVWPAGTAIDEQHPELRWPALDGARSVVSIASDGGEIARSDELTASRWRVPVALRRGRMYRWQAVVERGEESVVVPAPPAPPAIFRVISEREHDELARARRDAAGDHLLLALLYARAGMVAETRRELAATRDPLAAPLLRQLPSL